ncbi:MAG: response regulator [Bacteriovoracaceae bacterium]
MEEYSLTGKTLLVVDDEIDLRDIVASELEFSGAKVFRAENIINAERIIKENKVDVVISDIRMPSGTGIELLDHLKEHNVEIPPVILITGFADISPEEAYDKGAEVLMSKPFKLDDLIKTVFRYSHPVDQRFNILDEPPTKELTWKFNSSIQEQLNQSVLKIGRGGMSLVLDNLEKKLENLDVIKFNLSFKDIEIHGIGVCRWVKSSEFKQTCLGIEFLFLDPTALNFFLSFWKDHRIIAFIPNGTLR